MFQGKNRGGWVAFVLFLLDGVKHECVPTLMNIHEYHIALIWFDSRFLCIKNNMHVMNFVVQIRER